jgi:hypothetical protein
MCVRTSPAQIDVGLKLFEIRRIGENMEEKLTAV